MEVPIRASRLSAILKILGTDGVNTQPASATASVSQLLLTLVADSAAVTGINLTNGVLKLTVSARVTHVLLNEEPDMVHAGLGATVTTEVPSVAHATGNVLDDLDEADSQFNLAVPTPGPSVDTGTRHSSTESRSEGTVADFGRDEPPAGQSMLEDIDVTSPADSAEPTVAASDLALVDLTEDSLHPEPVYRLDQMRYSSTIAKPDSRGSVTLEDIDLSSPKDVEPLEELNDSAGERTAQTDPKGPITTEQHPLSGIVLEDLD